MSGLRHVLRVLLYASVFATCAAQVQAQTYPTRPVRIVVPYPPGGFNDLLTRAVAERLSQAFKQQFVIDNKPGANYLIATEYVARSVPDGYTLQQVGDGAMSANPFLYSKLPYDPQKDLTPVALLVLANAIFIVPAESPARSLREFVEHAKANPGKLNYYSVGSGSPPHLNMELFKQKAGIDIVHVPFKGGAPGLIALLGGQVQAALISIPSPLPHVRSGKVRVLAVGGAQRAPILPNVPTFEEQGYAGYRANAWTGIVAPAGTPREIVAALNSEINKVLNDPEFREKRLYNAGLEPAPMSVEQFAEFLRVNREEAGHMVKISGAKLD
jgi:tripartite-type tricarboxylate transporter receptor subunit TctC